MRQMILLDEQKIGQEAPAKKMMMILPSPPWEYMDSLILAWG